MCRGDLMSMYLPTIAGACLVCAGLSKLAPSLRRPLMVVLDNYSVHTSQTVAAASPQLAGGRVHLVYLPSYCPQLSAIEPDWNAVKQQQLSVRSFAHVADLKRAVDDALEHRAHRLQQQYAETTNIGRSPT